MYDYKIGVMLHSFKMELKETVKKAAEIGVDGLQFLSGTKTNNPKEFGISQRKELLSYFKDNGLVFTAICADIGYFYDREENKEIIELAKRVIDLSRDLETDIVAGHIGAIPADKNHERFGIMQEAMYEIGSYAASVGSCFAIETGPETSATLKGFLDSLDCKGVGVNLDPANLIMITGDDPVQAVYNLKDYIVHTHAKDGIRFDYNDPEIIYGAKPVDKVVKHYKEMPLGQGSVPFPEYLKALEDIGYRGFLTIEREVGDNPVADIKLGLDYLKGIIANN